MNLKAEYDPSIIIPNIKNNYMQVDCLLVVNIYLILVVG